MSDICKANTATDTAENMNHKIKHEVLQDKLKGVPGALQYIRMLERQIRKQKKKLKKLKSRFKSLPEVKEIGIQTDNIFDEHENTKQTKSLSEEIREAAEEATQNSGFVYDECIGLYYDSNTGYYYNAEYGLYYDANTGTYLTFKQETNTYEFHSQVQLPTKEYTKKSKRKKKYTDDTKAPKCQRVKLEESPNHETEEGECSVSSEVESDVTDDSDVLKQYPPCMRIIVEQSQLPKIKTGSLYILTFQGGTLGREGNHDILIPDISISKCHLKITYDNEKKTFFAIDLGSRNGTILNGKRMSASKQESEALTVVHGSRIQIGSVVLLCHVHDGNRTCGHCEPGLVQANNVEKVEIVKKITKSEQHKSELKKLRKKFGINPFEDANIKLASGYKDRAQTRRETVGSQNSYEKTETASLHESISSKNKGFKMLSKMGWKEGQSLGKDNQGVLEPIPIVSNPGTSGIGITNIIPSIDVGDVNKQIIWKKTQERFKQLPKTIVFVDSD